MVILLTGAKNVAAAVMAANSMGVQTIGTTGKDGGKLAQLKDPHFGRSGLLTHNYHNEEGLFVNNRCIPS